jgi:hypothetical protein
MTITWLLTGNEPEELSKAQTENERESLAVMREIPFGEQAKALEALRKHIRKTVTLGRPG